jgi:hypothetical protein
MTPSPTMVAASSADPTTCWVASVAPGSSISLTSTMLAPERA